MAQPNVMTGAGARHAPQRKMSNLFDKVDASGAGSITKAQFDQAFQTMKPPASIQAIGGTGSVNKKDFVDTMIKVMRSRRQLQEDKAASVDMEVAKFSFGLPGMV